MLIHNETDAELLNMQQKNLERTLRTLPFKVGSQDRRAVVCPKSQRLRVMIGLQSFLQPNHHVLRPNPHRIIAKQ